VSFGSDTLALFAGMLFGKHKLAPLVSPKKTVEGGLGGLLGGVLGMLVVKWIAEPLTAAAFSYGFCVLTGLVGSVISQIGDLSFSVIKREFGIKDYGKLLPGHGGVLDRFDSVTFAAPFLWLLLSYMK
jgi:phosphatidate cytidylyltransferase